MRLWLSRAAGDRFCISVTVRHLLRSINWSFALVLSSLGPAAAESESSSRCLRYSQSFDRRAFEPNLATDTLNYPPDSPLDVIHQSLVLRFDDLMSKQFDGLVRYFVRPRTEAVTIVRFDAVDLDIGSIQVEQTSLESIEPASVQVGLDQVHGIPISTKSTYYDAQQSWIEFTAPLPVKTLSLITIRYRCTDPIQGLVYALPEGGHSRRPLTIHSQGQSEFSRYWFPCVDSPVDRFTSDMRVTVPNGYEAVANGKLLSHSAEVAGQTTFHWWLSTSQPSYLVSLVIGQFDVIEDRWRNIPMRNYVPAGRRDDGVRTFQRTPEMMECFSRLLEVDYPYEQYSQTAVFRFGAEGMENTAATTYTDAMLVDEWSSKDHDEEALIAHELAHQWFGDLVTCRSWSDLWLNEGLATFLEVIWLEQTRGRDEYLTNILGKIEGLSAADGSEKGVPLVYRDYSDPEETFGVQGGLPYDKGCVLVHMLRHELGDDLLWKVLNLYLTRFREGLVETADFRRVIEEVTGRDFEHFFDQWAFRPGIPEIHARFEWNAERSVIEATVEQKQAITTERPAFAFPLDITITMPTGTMTQSLACDAKINQFTIPVAQEPTLVEFDANCGLLANLQIEKPLAMWLPQLESGPTVVSRIRAARRLGDEDSDEAVTALSKVLSDESAHNDLRIAAADSLAQIDTHTAWEELRSAADGQTAIASSHVRAAVVEWLADKGDEPEIASMMKRLAKSADSVRVQAAALEALGQIRDEESLAILIEKADVNSYSDKIRWGAIEGLVSHGNAAGLPLVMKYAAHGNHDRLRPHTIRALGDMGAHVSLRDEVRAALIAMLDDAEPEAVNAAIDALATIDDDKSRKALEFKRDCTSNHDRRRKLDRAIASLNGQSSASAEISELSDQAGELRDELQELSDQLYELEQRSRPDPFAASQP